MLTGDNANVADKIAAEVGVTDVRAELLPENKVDAVRGLQQAYGPTAMVGDGINDAPALATANVGIAMGGAGNAQAMETADVTLMRDNLSQLPFLFALSRATMRTIPSQRSLEFGHQGGVSRFGAVGVEHHVGWPCWPIWGTSLLVTLNGMRMLRHGKSFDN